MIGSDRPFLKPPPVYGRFKLNPWEGRSLKPSRDSHTLMPNRPAETNHCLIVPALVIHAPHFQPISPHTQNVLQHLQYPAIELSQDSVANWPSSPDLGSVKGGQQSRKPGNADGGAMPRGGAGWHALSDPPPNLVECRTTNGGIDIGS